MIDEGWNNSKEAITNQMSALNYQMKGQDEKGIIDSYLIIGAIQLNNAEYEIAFEYFEKALFHSIKILNPPLISRCFLMFAEEFIILGNQNAARKILARDNIPGNAVGFLLDIVVRAFLKRLNVLRPDLL